MRLKCGFIIRTLLLTTLLYLIYLISKDDASSQTLKDSILHQLPNNHYHNRRSQWLQHREAEIEKVKNNLSDDENRFIDPENIQSNSENFNADFDSNFNDADSNDSSSQSKTRSSQNRFGKVPIQVKKFEGVEVNFNSIENDASKFNHKQTGKIPDFEDEVTDNSLKIQAEIVPKRQFHRTYDPDEIEQPMRIPENYNPKLDTLRGTVGSLIYFNSTVKEPYYTPKFLGNYEEVTNPCEHVDSHESYAKNDGECGRAIKLNAEEEKQVPDIIKKFGFNLIASDKVPMTRNPKDLRHKECKHWNYPAKVDLPKVIVILVFYNEGWGPLMRTVHLGHFTNLTV